MVALTKMSESRLRWRVSMKFGGERFSLSGVVSVYGLGDVVGLCGFWMEHAR
jgi:hypothetical protein